MSTLQKMLSHYKAERGIRTDAALATALGASRTAFANYKSGERRLPDMAIVKLAEGLSIPTEEVLAAVNLNMKNVSQFEMTFWLGKILDLGSSYVVPCLLVGVTLFLTLAPEPAQAAALRSQFDNNTNYATIECKTYNFEGTRGEREVRAPPASNLPSESASMYQVIEERVVSFYAEAHRSSCSTLTAKRFNSSRLG